MLHFDLVDLRLIVRIAETNSLTKGAEAAFMSLPTASGRVKNFEESVGGKLFYRTSQGVTLTPIGQAVLHHARLVLGQLEHMRGDLQEYTRGIKGHLRLFSNTTALGEFLPPVLRTYLLRHPDVNIDLRERLSHDIVRAVSEGQTDIGIVANTVRTESLEVIPYRAERLMLVVPQHHPLAAQGRTGFVPALEYDFVGLPEGSAIQTYLRQVAEQAHAQLKMRIQVGGFETICRMVEAGVGLAVVPASAAERHARSMSITPVMLTDAWALRAMHICVRSLEALPLFARDMVQLLVEDGEAARSAGSHAAVL